MKKPKFKPKYRIGDIVSLRPRYHSRRGFGGIGVVIDMEKEGAYAFRDNLLIDWIEAPIGVITEALYTKRINEYDEEMIIHWETEKK